MGCARRIAAGRGDGARRGRASHRGLGGTVRGLAKALEGLGRPAELLSTSAWLLPWPRVRQLTSSPELADDPDFDRLASGELAELLRVPGRLSTHEARVLIVFGPGAALRDPCSLVRGPAQALRRGGGHLGRRTQPGPAGRTGPGDDPPAVLPRLAGAGPAPRRRSRPTSTCWLDLPGPGVPPAWPWTGGAARATLADLAAAALPYPAHLQHHPVGRALGAARARPQPGAPNTALGYELIAPESGILVGTRRRRRVECRSSCWSRLHPADLSRRARARDLRHLVSDPLRLPGHRGRRQPLRALPPAARLHAARLRLALHPARDLLHDGGRSGPPGLPRAARRTPTSTRSGGRPTGAVHEGVPFDIERYVQTFPAERAPALPDPGRHPARQRRGQRGARDQRDALPLLPALLRLAAQRPRGTAAAGPRRARVREPRRRPVGRRRAPRPGPAATHGARGRRLARGRHRPAARDVLRGPAARDAAGAVASDDSGRASTC